MSSLALILRFYPGKLQPRLRVGHGAQSGDIKRLKLPRMSRANLLGRQLKSPDDVKAATVQLRHALEAAGVTVAPSKVLEVIAQLCGAANYHELQKSLKGTPQLDRSERSADIRLLTLPELLAQSSAEAEGTLVGQLLFWQKDSAPHWRYAVSLAAIEPTALEAARRLVLGLPLRATDAKWVTGSSSKMSVINNEESGSPLTVDTASLAGAAYLGDGQWSVGANHYCSVSVDDRVLIEKRSVSVPLKVMAQEAVAAVRFAPPPEFAVAGFELFTVNIETQLTLRCLKLPHAGRLLESLRLVAKRLPWDRSSPADTPHGLRTALFRADKTGRVQVATVYGPIGPELAGLRWEGTRWDGKGSPTVAGSPERQELTGSGIEESRENGLTRIWMEIRVWISWCDGSAEADARSFPQFLEQAEEAKVSLSQIRRADMQKWVAGARDWEQPSGESNPKLPRSLP
jgi:hypothetical protein